MTSDQQNAVSPRKHVNVVRSDSHIVDLGLRQQKRKLPAHRSQLVVREQSTRSQARAVEQKVLAYAQQFTRLVKLANDHASSSQQKVPHQRVEVNSRLDQH